MEARDAFMLYACPSLGALLAFCMFISPMRAVLAVNRRKQLGEVNPLPFAAMIANGMGWLAYGLHIHDYFVFGSNVSALLLGLFYVMTVSKFAEEKMQDLLRNILLALCCLFLAVSLVFMGAGLDAAGNKSLWGSTAVAILAIYYVSPLTTLAKVLRRRDSSSLYRPMLIANIGNGLLWFAYGLATHDWFLIMPNGIGAAFNVLSLGISLMFPATERNKRLKQQRQQQQEQGQLGSFSRRVSDSAAEDAVGGSAAGTRPLSWLTGIARMPGSRQTAAAGGGGVSPLAAEEAIHGPDRMLDAQDGTDFRAVAAAEQQALHVVGFSAASRTHLGRFDGKDDSIV
ncbi:hypothetical protein OEZ86_014583 [Tetradesmus obliquus]|nr:hypothetical protein OEZ86_014583 [Tetradesmus obliquus]